MARSLECLLCAADHLRDKSKPDNRIRELSPCSSVGPAAGRCAALSGVEALRSSCREIVAKGQPEFKVATANSAGRPLVGLGTLKRTSLAVSKNPGGGGQKRSVYKFLARALQGTW